jgi:hypothetical protein
MHTPATCRPARGLTNGRPGAGWLAGMVSPQFEQKWALKGKAAPQREQNTAISIPPRTRANW